MAGAGLAVPLAILFASLAVIGLLLLAPAPLSKAGIQLCRASKNEHGRIVLMTVAGLLVLMMASPAIEVWQLSRTEHHDDRERNEQEARTSLSVFLILGDLLLLFVLREMGCTLGANERMRANEAALLRQVQGLQAEYNRVASEGGGKAPAPAGAPGGNGEAAALRSQVEALREENEALAAKAEAALRGQRSAESNAAALKSQSAGLANEFDRLLEEHTRLQRRLAMLDPGSAGGGATVGKKDM